MKNIITKESKLEGRFLKAYKSSNVNLKQVRSGNVPRIDFIPKRAR